MMILAAAPAAATGLKIEIAGQAEGTVTLDLFEEVASEHAARITRLAQEGAYDGVVFHRVIEGFVAQTGDLSQAGMGGSDLPDLPAEFSEIPFTRGAIGMARSRAPVRPIRSSSSCSRTPRI